VAIDGWPGDVIYACGYISGCGVANGQLLVVFEVTIFKFWGLWFGGWQTSDNKTNTNLCSVCFGVKWFLENDFGILWCLVGVKMMVNEKHFWFDYKTFFNFWKTIYGFKNRKSFFKIKLFVLARTFDILLLESCHGRSSDSRRHWNLATSDHRNIADAGIRRHPARISSDLAKMAGI
jgi:hypothetical protein